MLSANPLQKLFLLKYVPVNFLQLLLGFLLLLIVILLVLPHVLIVILLLHHHLLHLFLIIVHLLRYVLLKYLSLSQPSDLLFQLVVFPAYGVQQIMLFDQKLLIFFAILKKTVVLSLQLREKIILVNNFGLESLYLLHIFLQHLHLLPLVILKPIPQR